MNNNNTKYDALLVQFNSRLKGFVQDLMDSFGTAFSCFKTIFDMLENVSNNSTIIADNAWTMFNRQRHLIEQKTPPSELFTQDLFGFGSFGLNAAAFGNAVIQSGNADIIHDELQQELLLLDMMHSLKPFATPSTKIIKQHQKINAAPTPAPEMTKDGDEKKKVTNTNTSQTTKMLHQAGQVKLMMDRLMPLTGNQDTKLRADVESMFSAQVNNDDGSQEPTKEQQDVFERVLDSLLNNVVPSEDESDGQQQQQRNDPRFAEAALAMEKVQSAVRSQKIHEIFKNMTLKEDDNDPIVKQRQAAAAAKQLHRKSTTNVELNSQYHVEAHFNFRLLEFLDHFVTFRGRRTYTHPKTGKATLYFPQISQIHKQVEKLFTENKSTDVILLPFGAWVVKHHDEIQRRDKSIFVDPAKQDHPFLKTFPMANLWKTFKPNTEEDMWNKAQRLFTLAAVYHDMKTQGFGELMEIINEVLEDSQISYNVNAKTFRGKRQLINSVIDRMAESSGLQRIKDMCNKMQERENAKTSNSNDLGAFSGILQLMDHLVPSLPKPRKTQTQTQINDKEKQFETEDTHYDA